MTLVSLMYFDICLSISHLRLNSKYTNQLSSSYLQWAQTANLMSLFTNLLSPTACLIFSYKIIQEIQLTVIIIFLLFIYKIKDVF